MSWADVAIQAASLEGSLQTTSEKRISKMNNETPPDGFKKAILTIADNLEYDAKELGVPWARIIAGYARELRTAVMAAGSQSPPQPSAIITEDEPKDAESQHALALHRARLEARARKQQVKGPGGGVLLGGDPERSMPTEVAPLLQPRMVPVVGGSYGSADSDTLVDIPQDAPNGARFPFDSEVYILTEEEVKLPSGLQKIRKLLFSQDATDKYRVQLAEHRAREQANG